MQCPRDLHELVRTQRKRVDVDVCPTCNGVWLDASELGELIGTWRDLPRAQNAGPEKLPCPRGCGSMNSCWYSELRRVTVDRCPICDGIWLDNQEIDAILGEVYSFRAR